eukprot:5468543-Pleurochrysis_carterae.AAC.1
MTETERRFVCFDSTLSTKDRSDLFEKFYEKVNDQNALRSVYEYLKMQAHAPDFKQSEVPQTRLHTSSKKSPRHSPIRGQCD